MNPLRSVLSANADVFSWKNIYTVRHNLCLMRYNRNAQFQELTDMSARESKRSVTDLQRIKRYDTNLLIVLRTLLETTSVSETARRLGSTQPSVSRMLERLRDDLGDLLLVKSSNIMRRTKRAEELRPLLDNILDLLRSVYRSPDGYRLEQENRICVVGANDSLQAIFSAPLIERMRSIKGAEKMACNESLAPTTHILFSCSSRYPSGERYTDRRRSRMLSSRGRSSSARFVRRMIFELFTRSRSPKSSRSLSSIRLTEGCVLPSLRAVSLTLVVSSNVRKTISRFVS